MMNQRKLRGAACVLLLFLVGPLRAQEEVAPGFDAAVLPTPGFLTRKLVTLSDGRFVQMRLHRLRLFEEDGTVIADLLSGFELEGGLAAAPDDSFLLAGSDEPNGVHRVDLATFQSTFLPTGAFSPDEIVIADADTAYMRGQRDLAEFSLLFRIDPATGAFVRLGTVSDPSLYSRHRGLALDSQGNLYTQGRESAAEPSFLRRFGASLLDGSVVVDPTLGEALFPVADVNAVTSLALDEDDAHVYLTEVTPGFLIVGVLARLMEVPLADPSRTTTLHERAALDGEVVWFDGLRFAPGPGPAIFAAFQPSSGGRLIFNALVGPLPGHLVRQALFPERPSLTLRGAGTQGPGAIDLETTGGPPGGFGLVLYGPLSSFDPLETAFPGFAVPLFLGLDPATLSIPPLVLFFDAQGTTQRSISNPTGITGVAVQVLVFDSDGTVAGTSEGVSF